MNKHYEQQAAAVAAAAGAGGGVVTPVKPALDVGPQARLLIEAVHQVSKASGRPGFFSIISVGLELTPLLLQLLLRSSAPSNTTAAGTVPGGRRVRREPARGAAVEAGRDRLLRNHTLLRQLLQVLVTVCPQLFALN